AQSLTDRHVKGMLTGPVTILNWSFAHDATPRSEITKQIALAVRKEIAALASSGIQIIQVDDTALREGLPLDTAKGETYLNNAAYAFRLATASVQPETQIHTHMCYSNFEDIFPAIDALDADVISIETSRRDRKSTRLNSSHVSISYAVFCLKKKKKKKIQHLINKTEVKITTSQTRIELY